MGEGELVRMYCELQVGKLMLGIWAAFLRYYAQNLFRVFLAMQVGEGCKDSRPCVDDMQGRTKTN